MNEAHASTSVQNAIEKDKDERSEEKKFKVLESHGFFVGKIIGAGNYATVRVRNNFFFKRSEYIRAYFKNRTRISAEF